MVDSRHRKPVAAISRVEIPALIGVVLATVGGIALWLAGCAAPVGPRPTGLLLITLDTIRADRLGAYGHSTIQTPFIDDLAARGVLFERALAPVPLTLPSHTSLLTGTYPPRHGVRDNVGFVVPEELTTLAELFSAQGFRTGAFVGAVVLDRQWGLDQGFEEYSGDFGVGDFEVGDLAELISVGDIQRPANEVVDDALGWLGRLGEEPFFAWVHLFDPHDPYDPPSPFREQYPDDPYLGEVAFADTQLTRLGEWLRASGRSENTLVVFVGDHGEGFGEHGESGHGFFLYQEAVRVPLIVVDPFMGDRGTRREEPVSLVDLFSTMCERFGLEVPPQNQGRSLIPLLGGPGAWHEEPIYSETLYPFFHFGWSPLSSIQDRGCVYIDSSEPELYDLAADPAQLEDLSATRPDVLGRFKETHDVLVEELAREASDASRMPDAETVAKLAALGYLGGAGSPVAPSSRSDLASPRRRIGAYNNLNEAREAIAAGQLEVAESLLGEALEDDPYVAETYSLLGKLRTKQGRIADAEAMFETGLGLKPDELSLTISLATAKLQLGRIEEGLAVLERAIERRPDESWLVLLLGSFARQAGKVEVAARALERAVVLDPSSAGARLELGVLEIQRGNFARAEQMAKETLELSPGLPGAHLCLGQSLQGQGRLGDAAAEYEAERRIAPLDHRPVYALARLQGRLGRADEEGRLLAETIQLEPDFAPAYLFLARNLMTTGASYPEAIELVHRALARHPKAANLALAYYLLADLYNRTGDDKRSMEYAMKGKEADEPARADLNGGSR